jgi:hypothetical protein
VTDYLHTLDGRMRIKIAPVKGSPAKAAEVSRFLMHSTGIYEVTANSVTGNVLILYNSDQISQNQIMKLLQDGGYLSTISGVSPAQGDGLVAMVGRAVMETVLQSMVLALI